MKKTPNGLVLVVIKRSFGAYGIGTKAAFTPAEASRLVANGDASHIGGNPQPEVKIDAEEPMPVTQEDEGNPLDAILADPDWRSMNGNRLRSIAKQVSDFPLTSKQDAIAAIELALSERDGE